MRLIAILTLFSVSMYTQTPGRLPADPLNAALSAHGGAAVDSVSAIQLVGQSTDWNGTLPVTITAQIDGHIRFDYGQPVQRSLVHTPDGEFIKKGTAVEYKQPFVDLFGTLDPLSILGLRQLETSSPVWTDGGTAVDGGRSVRVMNVSTGQSQRRYGRVLKEEFQVAFDAQTGLVSSVTRQQYSDKSLDLVFPVVYRFSDYRTVQNVVFPYRIEKSVFDRVTETIVITSVVLNPPIPGSIFAR